MSRAPSRRNIISADHRGVEQCEHFGLYPNGKPCFSCGRILRDAADEHSIYTRVASGLIFLHPWCAAELGKRLVNEAALADAEAEDARQLSGAQPRSPHT